ALLRCSGAAPGGDPGPERTSRTRLLTLPRALREAGRQATPHTRLSKEVPVLFRFAHRGQWPAGPARLARAFTRVALPYARAMLGSAAVALSTSCEQASDPVGTHGGAARLAFAPRFAHLGASNAATEPINRIRLTAREQSSGALLGRQVLDVDPDANGWN